MILLARNGTSKLAWNSRPLLKPPRAAAAACRLNLSLQAASDPDNSTQIWISRSHDVLLNLSVESHLLQVTPAQSRVLLVYANAPCIVLGRNQNPWREANLRLVANYYAQSCGRGNEGCGRRRGNDECAPRLVRRRSGGGAVFHDEGNVNYCVMCPSMGFDRDMHANMVVRALHALGRTNTLVNARHDIVMTDEDAAARGKPYKISGSAYKLVRGRALHHGTCLLNSPNLANISKLLDSPAKPYLTGHGVESVSSSVRNAGLDRGEFEDAVVTQFQNMYGPAKVLTEFGPETLSEPKVKAGYEELQSDSWVFGQTPRFTFDTHMLQQGAAADRHHERPQRQRVLFEAKHGVIEKCKMGKSLDESPSLVGIGLHDIDDWSSWLTRAGMDRADSTAVGGWMNQILCTRFTENSD